MIRIYPIVLEKYKNRYDEITDVVYKDNKEIYYLILSISVNKDKLSLEKFLEYIKEKFNVNDFNVIDKISNPNKKHKQIIIEFSSKDKSKILNLASLITETFYVTENNELVNKTDDEK